MKTVILEIGESTEALPYSCNLSLLGNGNPQQDFPLPPLIIDQTTLAALSMARGSAVTTVRSRELGPTINGKAGGSLEDLAKHAEWLHNLVFRSELLDKLKDFGLCAGDSNTVRNCRLILNIKASSLRSLQFERMAKGTNRPAMLPTCSVLRGPVELNDHAEPCDGPIRVLVVIGSKPNDNNVRAEEEVAELRRVLFPHQSEITLRVFDRVGIEALIQLGEAQNVRGAVKLAYQDFQPHIFHFIGHGDLDGAGNPFLVLFDPAALPDQNLTWTLPDMIADFNRMPPAFVFLNACYTVDAVATQDKEGRSIADIFLEEIGSRGVLGMHSAIRGETAGRLAGSLYRAFCDGKSIDLALTEARGAADILKSNDPAREWDWAIPYLRLRVLPEEVIPVKFVPLTRRELIGRSKKFDENKFFIDRETHREEFWQSVGINPGRPGKGPSSNVVLIRGKPGIGKTRLMCFCLESAALSGRLLKYVDLSGKESLDWMGVLRQIKDGTKGSQINSPLPGELFAKIDLSLDANGPEDQQKEIFSAFRDALWKVPATIRETRVKELEEEGEFAAADQVRRDRRPFLLVLDQIISLADPWTGKREGGVIPALFKHSLIPELIQPLYARRERDLQLVLAVREEGIGPDEFKELGLDALDPSPPAVTLGEIGSDDFAKYAEDYLQRKGIDAVFKKIGMTTEDWKAQIDSRAELLSKRQNKTWSPSYLVAFYKEIMSAIGETP